MENKDRMEREYIEIMASIRHYSKLRFTGMSVFYAANAALVIGVFNLRDGGIDPQIKPYLKLAGILVTLVLFSYDIICDSYQTNFRKYLESVWPESHWFKRPSFGQFAQVPAQTLYVGILLVWVLSLLR